MLLKNKQYFNVVAISLKGKVSGHTFKTSQKDKLKVWLAKHNGKANVYYMPNEPRADAPNNKLKESDIAFEHALYLDLDFDGDKSLASERKRLRALAAKLKKGKYPPSLAIDSGGGIQLFWYLSKKLPAKKYSNLMKALNRGLIAKYGGDKVQNRDRLMRFPNTMNLPTEKKIKKGRVETKAVVLYKTGQYTLHDFKAFIDPIYVSESLQDGNVKIAGLDMSEVRAVDDVLDLSVELKERLAFTLANVPELGALWAGKRLPTMTNDTRSEFDFTAAYYLKQAFNDPTDFAQVLSCLPSGKGPDGDLTEREITRIWNRVAYKTPMEEFGELPDDEHELDSDDDSEDESFFIFERDLLTNMKPIAWIVEKLIAVKAIGYLFGQPGVGKTFILLDILLSVAAGIKSNDRSVKQGLAIAIVGEGESDFPHRVRAWRKYHKIEDGRELPFVITRNPGNFESDDYVKLLKKNIYKIMAGGDPPLIIGIDTLRANASVDENSNKDMTLLMRRIMVHLRNEFGCAIILTHHPNKTTANDLSGAGSMKAGSDFLLYLKAKGDQFVELTCKKMKMGKPNDAYGYFEKTLIPFTIAETPETPETEADSLVYVPCSKSDDDARKALTDIQSDFLSILPEGGATKEKWGDLYRESVFDQKLNAATLRSRIHSIPDFLWANDYVLLEDGMYIINDLKDHDIF